MAPQLLTREGPTTDEVQIIGVELAATPPGGQVGEVELAMFGTQLTLPKAQRDIFGFNRTEVRVTLHTSAGDMTLRGYAPNW